MVEEYQNTLLRHSKTVLYSEHCSRVYKYAHLSSLRIDLLEQVVPCCGPVYKWCDKSRQKYLRVQEFILNKYEIVPLLAVTTLRLCFFFFDILIDAIERSGVALPYMVLPLIPWKSYLWRLLSRDKNKFLKVIVVFWNSFSRALKRLWFLCTFPIYYNIVFVETLPNWCFKTVP